MKNLIWLLLCLYSVGGQAQNKSNPKVEITSSLGSYTVVTNVPKNFYKRDAAGMAELEAAVKTGQWTLTTDEGCVIPKGSIPPAIKPNCCGLSVAVNSPTISCSTTAVLTAVASGSSSAGVSYRWKGPDSFTASGASIPVAKAQNGVYSYTVTATKTGSCSAVAVSNVTVSGCGTAPTLAYFNRGVIIGNSITYHPPNAQLGWLYDWGMAASAANRDFVHLMEAELKAVNPNFQMLVSYDGAYFEGQYKNISDGIYKAFYTDAVTTKFGAGNPVDFIYIPILENVDMASFDAVLFRAALEKLIAAVPHTANCTIMMRNSFWLGKEAAEAVVKQFCQENGYKHVDISSVRGKVSPLVDGKHPNDEAMQGIATLSLNQLRTAPAACDLTLTANSTTATCGASVQLVANATGSSASGLQFSWTGSNGTVGTGSTITITAPAANGSYQYTVTASKSNCTRTATATLAVSGCSAPITTAGYAGMFADNNTYVPLPELNRPSMEQQFPRGFLTSGNTKVAYNVKMGGIIDYLTFDNGATSDVNSPIWDNGIDDPGRQLAPAAYPNPNGAAVSQDPEWGEGPFIKDGRNTGDFHGGPGEPSIGNNPVLGGSEGRNGHFGTTVDYYNNGTVMYHNSIPKQWEIHGQDAEMRMLAWTQIDPANNRAIRIHDRWSFNRTDQFINAFGAPRQQEARCFYTTPDFYRVFFRTGQPWTNAPLVEFIYNERIGTIALPFILASEPWIMIKNRNNNQCRVLISTNARFVVGGFNNGGFTTNVPTSLMANYIASAPIMHMDPNGVYDFDNVVFGGTEAECLAYINTLTRLKTTIWNGRPEYIFNQKSRLGCYLHHARDQREANITDYISVKPMINNFGQAGRDYNFSIPERWINGREVKKIYVRMAVTSQDGQFWLRWKKPGSAAGTEYFQAFDVQNDGQFRTIEIDMTNVANWDGTDITTFVFMKRNNLDTTNDELKIKWISYRNLTSTNP